MVSLGGGPFLFLSFGALKACGSEGEEDEEEGRLLSKVAGGFAEEEDEEEEEETMLALVAVMGARSEGIEGEGIKEAEEEEEEEQLVFFCFLLFCSLFFFLWPDFSSAMDFSVVLRGAACELVDSYKLATFLISSSYSKGPRLDLELLSEESPG